MTQKLVALTFAAFVCVGATGCELLVDFDRDKILVDGGPSDASSGTPDSGGPQPDAGGGAPDAGGGDSGS